MPTGQDCLYCFNGSSKCWIHGTEIKYSAEKEIIPVFKTFEEAYNHSILYGITFVETHEDISDDIPCTD
jgi:hypothetical protein